MGAKSTDLSGRWDGTFSYPDVPEAGPVTPFLATLADSGGVLSGSIIEPHEFASGTAHSTLVGQRIGRSVHFSKTYHGAGDEYRETVLYFGSLCDEGEVITGEWRIDHWRGPFEMVRELGGPAAVEETAAEAIPTAADASIEMRVIA